MYTKRETTCGGLHLPSGCSEIESCCVPSFWPEYYLLCYCVWSYHWTVVDCYRRPIGICFKLKTTTNNTQTKVSIQLLHDIWLLSFCNLLPYRQDRQETLQNESNTRLAVKSFYRQVACISKDFTWSNSIEGFFLAYWLLVCTVLNADLWTTKMLTVQRND